MMHFHPGFHAWLKKNSYIFDNFTYHRFEFTFTNFREREKFIEKILYRIIWFSQISRNDRSKIIWTNYVGYTIKFIASFYLVD